MRVQKGSNAIDFQVEDINGNNIILSQLKEQLILLSFFRYASCPFCNLRIAQLITYYPQFQKAGLEILAFFQSPKESIQQYIIEKHEKLPFPVVADPSHKVYDLYGVKSSRWGYFKGIIRLIPFTKAFRKGFRPGKVEGRVALIPADFLIDNLIIRKSYYGSNITDHMPLEDILDYLEGFDMV